MEIKDEEEKQLDWEFPSLPCRIETQIVSHCISVCLYQVQRDNWWPQTGKVIMAQYNSQAVLVYQSYNAEIADWAVKHQKFLGAPSWKDQRMTWIKTSFLWMMYRNGWNSKHNQERTLGIWIKRQSFERILGHAREIGTGKNKQSNAERDCSGIQYIGLMNLKTR
jgi:hypothetical protein